MSEHQENNQMALSEWQKMFNTIYGKRNKEEYAEDGWLLIKLVAESKNISKSIRKDDIADLRRHLPDFLAWVFGYANRHLINLEDELWNKYPGVCPHCFVENDCKCIKKPHGDVDQNRLEAYRKNTESKPSSITDWIVLLIRIYGRENSKAYWSQIGLHLFEEISEVSDIALRDYQKQKDETADVVAWLFALSFKVMHVYPDYSLEKELYRLYPGKCRKCLNAVCDCEK